ncbi:MAG: hypothetical protein ACFB3T_07885 [Geminicoccaceae bacterium]
MRARGWLLAMALGTLIWVLLLIAGASLVFGRAAMAADITLELSAPGNAPTGFTMSCALTRGDGTEQIFQDGVTPARVTFAARTVTCEIRAEGPLEVIGTSASGNTTRTRTSGGVVRLSLS